MVFVDRASWRERWRTRRRSARRRKARCATGTSAATRVCALVDGLSVVLSRFDELYVDFLCLSLGSAVVGGRGTSSRNVFFYDIVLVTRDDIMSIRLQFNTHELAPMKPSFSMRSSTIIG